MYMVFISMCACVYTHHTKTLLHSKRNCQQFEKATYKMGENTFANHISGKELKTKIYKELIQCNKIKKNQTIQLKNRQRLSFHTKNKLKMD